MASINTLLSLARARFELRIPGSDVSQNDLLSGQIASAIASLTKDVNIPLLDQNAAVTIRLTGSFSSQFYDPYLKSITAIKYQPSSVDTPSYGSFPDTIDAGDYTVVDGERKGALVIVPIGVWPAAAFNRFRVEAVLGLADDDPALAAYRSAAILLFRSLYDGVAILREDSAYERIARPLRRMDLSIFNLIGLGTVPDPVDPVDPVDLVIKIALGWSDDDVAEEAELTVTSTGSMLALPDSVGNKHIVVWRSDAAGGDPMMVLIGGLDQRNIFGAVVPLEKDGISGQAITSSLQDSDLLSGTALEVR